MMTADQLYETALRELAPDERRRLADLLQRECDITEPPYWTLPGYSGEWTEDDMRDLTSHTLREAGKRYPDAEEQP